MIGPVAVLGLPALRVDHQLQWLLRHSSHYYAITFSTLRHAHDVNRGCIRDVIARLTSHYEWVRV
jgi:hypothetical protein